MGDLVILRIEVQVILLKVELSEFLDESSDWDLILKIEEDIY